MEEKEMDYGQMLEELAEVYPQLESKVMELKEDIMELMPEEEAPIEEPMLELDEEEEEIELEL